MLFRIGQGYDIHRFVPDRPLILGGFSVPSPLGLDGHSDADALTHAVIDAILGALAIGDIGQWFPDNDQQWKGASGKMLLDIVLDSPKLAGWSINNLDCTIITQKPKLAPFMPGIRQSLAHLLRCDVSAVSVKAKTNERLDDIGASLALAAHTAVLLMHP